MLPREVHYGREAAHAKHERSAGSDSYTVTQLPTATQHQVMGQFSFLLP